MFKYITSECPKSSLGQEEAAAAMGCAENNMYHCMSDQKGRLGEICVVPSWIQADFCPEYNTIASIVDEEKCNKSLGLCPQKSYLSNEVISYTGCLKNVQIPDLSASYSSSATVVSPTHSLSSSENYVVPIVVSLLACVLITCIATGIACLCRRQKRKHQRYPMKPEDEETHIMVPKTESFSVNTLAYFNQLSAYSKAKKYIDGKETFVIVGTPGSGKTSLCRKLFHQLKTDTVAKKPFQITFLKEIRFLPSYIKSDMLNIIFLDDCFEPWMYMTKRVSTDLKFLQQHVLPFNQRTEMSIIMVMTMDSAIWKTHKSKIAECDLFKNVLHMSWFDNEEKQITCINIFQANGVEIVETAEEDTLNFENITKENGLIPRLHRSKITSFITEWNNSSKELGFPLTCLIFCKSKYLLKKEKTFFCEPFKHLKGEITRMRSSSEETDALEYLTLVYTLLLGELDLSSIDDSLKEKLDDIILPYRKGSSFKQDSSSTEFERNRSLFAISSFLINIDKNKYNFIHGIVGVAIFIEFSEWQTGLLLKYCKLEYLLKYVCLDEDNARFSLPRERTLLLSEDICNVLARRFAQAEPEVVEGHVTLENVKMQEKYKSALQNLHEGQNEKSDINGSDPEEFVEIIASEAHQKTVVHKPRAVSKENSEIGRSDNSEFLELSIFET